MHPYRHTYLLTYVRTYIHTYTKKTSDRNDRKIDKQNDRPKLKSQKQIIKRELQKKCKKYIYIYIYINHLQCMAVSFFLTVAARGGHMPPWRHNNAAIKHAVTRMRPQDSYKIASSGNWWHPKTQPCQGRHLSGPVCQRKFRSQTSDNMDRWKAEVVRVKEEKRREEKRRGEERRGEEKRRRKKIKKRKTQKKEDPGARKGRKVAKHSVFPMVCGSGGSKSRLAS